MDSAGRRRSRVPVRRAAAALRAGAAAWRGRPEAGARAHRWPPTVHLPAPPRADHPTLDQLLRGELASAPPDGGSGTAGTEGGGPGAGTGVGTGVGTGGESPFVERRRAGRYGEPGRPLNRSHPFYLGFTGALGVLLAYAIVQLLGQLSAVLTLVAVSMFLALGLDPVVRWLQRHDLPRPLAIGVVFVALVGLCAAFFSAVVPPVVAQLTELTAQAPTYVQDLTESIQRNERLAALDREYRFTERLQSELQARLASGQTLSTVFGGIYGAGRAVASGVASVLTVLVLTLYFLASLRGITGTVYRLVPASRRRRVQLLGDEVIRRIGGYVIGQVSIAAINGVLTFVLLTVLGVPYSAALALVVTVVGLIPLVGATLGAVVAVAVALFTSVTAAVVLAVWFIAYQQFENYVIAPRVMQRTVSVPGTLALVAALAGGSLLGLLGALIAIPVAAGVLLVVQEVVMPRQDRH
ncbi:AI-2E family transporter [Quadrisphaera sp. DSM 44207]|uniref:AI-2E family transporter n=1 Tax=Quadrisphaera sp. DSM 44207 TaxID=1881057 RepID=UPI00115FA54A|nr:AI-2E family transporter [Quadrisphaera sp. DSM 44207]